ncbi:Vacuolar protein-sorting-associated protein 24 [Malassezia sp. CBS 17886]|nr:Vacuolar protein-sorting-associated protein 24 [Malassezia sp. CBS 17886]
MAPPDPIGSAALVYDAVMQSISRLVFGPSKEERVREVQKRLRHEQRGLDREVRQIDLAVGKVKGEIRRLAVKGDRRNAALLAREVVRSNKHRTRLLTSKAQLNSITLQLQQQLSMLKVTGSLQKSTEIMRLSNRLIRLPEMSQAMREMSSELIKAGVLEEMIQDTIDASVLGEEGELEEAAQTEVDQVLEEITGGKLGEAAPASALPKIGDADTPGMQPGAQNISEMQAALDGLLRG